MSAAQKIKAKTKAKTRAAKAKIGVRPLDAGDLDPVVAIDRKLSGRSRRGYFLTRLKAALKEPGGFIYIGAEAPSGTNAKGTEATGTKPNGAKANGAEANKPLAGFVLARIVEGEFGAAAPIAVLDAIGVDPEAQGAGVGHALIDALDAIMANKGIRELQSQVDWSNRTLTHFFASTDFEAAPRIVLDRATGALHKPGAD